MCNDVITSLHNNVYVILQFVGFTCDCDLDHSVKLFGCFAIER